VSKSSLSLTSADESSESLIFVTQSVNETALKTKINEVLLALTSSTCFSSNFKQVKVEQLGSALLKKASSEFLLQRKVSELIDVIIKSGECITEFYDSLHATDQKQKVALTWLEDGTGLRIIIVMHDRPFIVQSLATVFENLELDLSILLHPIISIEDELVSLVYIELKELRREILDQLKVTIERSLADVLACTEDYKFMLKRIKDLAAHFHSVSSPLATGSEKHPQINLDLSEISDLFIWLSGNSFLFMGVASWKITNGVPEAHPSLLPLGILTENHPDAPLTLCFDEVKSSLKNDEVFDISRLNIWSRVQRSQRLNHLIFRSPSSDPDSSNVVHSLVGIFTVAASNQLSTDVPIIRQNLKKIIELEGVLKSSHDFKFISRAIDHMPKELALNLNVSILRQFITVALGVHNHGKSQVALHVSPRLKRADVLVVVPKHAYSSWVKDLVCDHLENRFGCEKDSGEVLIDHSADPQVRIYVYLPIKPTKVLHQSFLTSIEQEIVAITQTWDEQLEEELSKSVSFPRSYLILEFIKDGNAFPPDYRARYSAIRCKEDTEALLTLNYENPLRIELTGEGKSEDGSREIELTVFSKGSVIPTNKALPILENFGFEVKNNITYEIIAHDNTELYIHRFISTPSKLILQNSAFDEVINSHVFYSSLIAVFQGEMENDVLNNLVLGAFLPHKAVAVLRAYAGYLWQVIRYATRGTIYHTLSKSPEQSTLLWQLFHLRFSPDLDRAQSMLKEDALVRYYTESLRSIKSISHDRILRAILSVVLHTKRTNFFQNRKTLAFKIHSRNLDILPNPKPMFEIYVRSTEFEGVHLRNGKTARGGIRWSERTEDYRHEVLGLMKTQTIKNALIVPTGAKGGFAVRYLPEDPNAMRAKVESCYREYIRALLSITDNIEDDKVVSPPNVVVHDDPDPYFVVAADKGTATFSDIANDIAKTEFNFWLGDAFASGGSNGYDHKKYGITARGAFESVKRHFHDLGIDYLQNSFTAVGIGDMSGDVFGNGMLLSNQIKLLGAFNHAHIFVDPSPDPAISFKERERLFTVPRSKWTDYNPALLSKGGAVYERFDKEITISPEARQAFGLSSNVPQSMNGEDLIRHILCAPCTLLWNGGIGTYVKASTETHSEVNDGTNDQVRVDANKLRAKVIGEGGNLGFTQLARIEFSKNQGRIITDAIDNSAGVDLSDHEVNIKLSLKPLIKAKLLSEEERNALLLEIVPEVITGVLEHNKNHSAIISLGLSRSLKSIHYFQSLLRDLEKWNYIDRTLEALPTAEDLIERATRKEGLYMPELAVCMAAVKMWLTEQILQSTLVQDPLLENYLLNYFPSKLQERFKENLLKHPLRREIIATQVTNSLVDAIGITFVHRMCISHSVSPITVVKCALAAELILDSRSIRTHIQLFDTPRDSSFYMEVRGDLNSGIRHATSWLIGWHGHELPLDKMVELYGPLYTEMVKISTDIFPDRRTKEILRSLTTFEELGLSREAAIRLAILDYIPSILDLLSIARLSQRNIKQVSVIYFILIDTLRLAPLLEREEEIDTANKWEHQIMVDAFERLRKNMSRIAVSFLEMYGDKPENTLKAIVENSRSYSTHLTTIEEIQSEKPSATSLSVLARQLESFRLG
jgi:glutamate dehydrogenase